MQVLITGATGLIGTALVDRLRADGHHPVRMVRGTAVGDDVRWDPSTEPVPSDAIRAADAVVNLAGAGIGDHRWTDDYRRQLRDSRVALTTALAEAIVAAGADAPAVFLSGSAIGYYGDRGDEVLTESSTAGHGFLAELAAHWEAASRPAEQVARVVQLRTGVVLSRHGGALAKQLPLFRFGLGARMGRGRQWFSWITLHDHVSAVVRLLTADVHGPVNLVAPQPVTNAEFTAALGAALHRPTFLAVPPVLPKLVLGGDLAQSLLFDSQRVHPEVLTADGFAWQHPALREALADVLGG